MLVVKAARPGFNSKEVRRFLTLFYADNRIQASRDAKRLQNLQDILVGLFECVGLHKKVIKTQCLMFLSGQIRTQLSNSSYVQ